ncbi:MAG: bifunctional nuclease family protein [Halobacteriaceae archaeon]
MNVDIAAVQVAGTPDGPTPVVVLAPREADADADADADDESDADEALPIFVGFDQAISITRGLDAVDIGRPLTHDLLLDVVEELGGRVDRVDVSDVREGTYIADLHLNTPRGDVVVDARPSDALALAARTGASVSVEREVFEDGARPREEFDELEDIREVADVA